MTTAIRNPIKSLCRSGWTLKFVSSLPNSAWADANHVTRTLTIAIDRYSSDKEIARVLMHEANHAILGEIHRTKSETN